MSWWQTISRLWRRDAQIWHLPSGLGGPEDPTAQTWFGMIARIPQAEADALYTHWVGRRVVDTLPEAMAREWGELVVGGEARSEIPERVDAELRRLGAREAFIEAQKLANLYGGAGIVIVLEDEAPPDQPVTNPRRIRELRVVDGWHLFPVLDPQADPRRPEHYRLHALDPLLVHRSRVLRFDGASVPADVMRLLDGWSDSVLRPILEPCRAYQTAIQSVAAAVRDYEILVHSVSRLGDLLREPGGREGLLTRARRNRQSIAVFRTLFLDRDAETVEFVSRNFSGIAEAVELLRQNLLAATGLPPAIFEGQFPSGLGATGISERLQWADHVRAAQEAHWNRPIEKLIRLILQTQNLSRDGLLWRWQWRSLFQLTDEEKVRLRQMQASADATYIRERVLLPEEVAHSRFGGSQYSWETVLDPELRKQKQAQAEGLFLDSAAAPRRRRVSQPQPLLPGLSFSDDTDARSQPASGGDPPAAGDGPRRAPP